MSHTSARYPVPSTGTALARRTATGVGVAVLLLLAAQALVDVSGVDLGASGSMSPFAALPLVGSTVAAGVGAAIAYAAAVEFTDRPVRTFLIVAVIVFAIMLVPVVVVTPSMDVTLVGQTLLVVYHLLVAVPIVGFVIGAVGA